jgi:alpha-tubulin suppressor-like RCC1 family protein
MIVKTDGSLWAAGNNSYGQLGDGTTTSTTTWKRIVF